MGYRLWQRRQAEPSAVADSINQPKDEVLPKAPVDERVEQQPARHADQAIESAEAGVSPAEVQASADSSTVTLSATLSSAEITSLNWSELKAAVNNCQSCALHESRTQAVFSAGSESAELMIIGEAPGADEDAQGEPFVGRAGKLLTEMLFALGLQRQQVYIANILKSRPLANRNPEPAEVAACLPYLQRQITLLQPKVILAVGKIAANQLLANEQALAAMRGQVHSLALSDCPTVPVVATYHPAYLLRSPKDKAKSWADLQLLQGLLAAN